MLRRVGTFANVPWYILGSKYKILRQLWAEDQPLMRCRMLFTLLALQKATVSAELVCGSCVNSHSTSKPPFLSRRHKGVIFEDLFPLVALLVVGVMKSKGKLLINARAKGRKKRNFLFVFKQRSQFLLSGMSSGDS